MRLLEEKSRDNLFEFFEEVYSFLSISRSNLNDFTWEEAQIISQAMIDNPLLTFMCSEDGIPRLLLAFELAGYHSKDLSSSRLVNPSTQQETWASVFIGHDLQNRLLCNGPE